MKNHDSSVFDAGAKDTGQPSVERFTPGPWRFDYGDSFDHHEDGEANGFEILMDGANPRVTGRCVAIHRIRYAEEVFPDDACRKEAEANARLIAAAPEMYEALAAQDAAVNGHSKCECSRHPESFLCGICSICISRYLRASQLREAVLLKAVPQTIDRTPGSLSNTDESINNPGTTSDGGGDAADR